MAFAGLFPALALAGLFPALAFTLALLLVFIGIFILIFLFFLCGLDQVFQKGHHTRLLRLRILAHLPLVNATLHAIHHLHRRANRIAIDLLQGVELGPDLLDLLFRQCQRIVA